MKWNWRRMIFVNRNRSEPIENLRTYPLYSKDLPDGTVIRIKPPGEWTLGTIRDLSNGVRVVEYQTK